MTLQICSKYILFSQFSDGAQNKNIADQGDSSDLLLGFRERVGHAQSHLSILLKIINFNNTMNRCHFSRPAATNFKKKMQTILSKEKQTEKLQQQKICTKNCFCKKLEGFRMEKLWHDLKPELKTTGVFFKAESFGKK